MKLLLETLKGRIPSRPPLWMMRQAGRYLKEYRDLRRNHKDFLSLCYDSEAAAAVSLQPITRFGFDGAIVFADILLIADALGRKVRFEEEKGPLLEPLSPDFSPAFPSEAEVLSRLRPVSKTIDLLRQRLPSETTLIGFCGAPLTVLTYMIEGGSSKTFEKTKSFGLSAPRLFEGLLEKLASLSAAYLAAQIKAGAEVVQIFESWGEIAPAFCQDRWVIAPQKHLIQTLRRLCPATPVIGFARGLGLGLETYVKETAIDAVSLDSQTDMKWAKARLAPHCVLQGNLSNIVLKVGGALLESHVRTLLETGREIPFIFNLDHGILPSTPIEHVQKVVDLVKGAS